MDEQRDDDPHGMASAIAGLDEEVGILNGYVVAYSYLDAQGEPSYGVRFGGEERALGLLGLTVVAQNHVFKTNLTDESED